MKRQWLALTLVFFAAFACAQTDRAFTQDKVNRALILSDFAVRMNDAVATLRLYSNGCQSELPVFLARSKPGMVAYSAAFSLGLNLASRQLWKHGHHTLARLLLVEDIAVDGEAGIHDEWIEAHQPRSVRRPIR